NTTSSDFFTCPRRKDRCDTSHSSIGRRWWPESSRCRARVTCAIFWEGRKCTCPVYSAGMTQYRAYPYKGMFEGMKIDASETARGELRSISAAAPFKV